MYYILNNLLMDANVVYTVVQALSLKEQEKLWYMLNEQLNHSKKRSNKKKIISDREAIHYLLKNVFNP